MTDNNDARWKPEINFPGTYDPSQNYRSQKGITQHFVFWRPEFVHPRCRFQHALLRNILRPSPSPYLGLTKSTTSLCETWYIVSYISYCDRFIHVPSMEGNFFVFNVPYYNNLSSLLLTFAAHTLSLSLVCLAWCTSHQDVYSSDATAIMGVGETRIFVHNKTVWCAFGFMFKSVLKFQKKLCFRISIVHLPYRWYI